MKRPAALLLVWMVAGCDHRSSTRPTEIVPPPQPEPPVTYRITGTVSEPGGAGVDGATVTAADQWAAVSDRRGAYTLTFEAAESLGSSPQSIVAERPGYERTRVVVSLAQRTAARDLRLYPVVRVQAGDSVRVRVAADDPICGINEEWTCRTVRVATPGSGMLTLVVIPDVSGAAGALEIGEGDAYVCCPPQTSVPLEGVREVPVSILRPWNVRGSDVFTLKTTFTAR